MKKVVSLILCVGILLSVAMMSNAEDSKKDRVTLRVEVYDRGNSGGTAPDNNYWTKWIQTNFGDKNNITLKFETSPRFDNNSKLQLWMASGTAPDVCYTNEIDPVNNFFKNGGLTDLNPALKKYGQQLTKFLGPVNLSRGVDVKTGERYALRGKMASDANESTWIRKDWLAKLHMNIPTNTTQWYSAMKAFKEKNPGNVSKVVPYAITYDVGWTAANLIESYKTDISDESRFIYSGRYLQIFAPGVKESLKFMNKMYNEGLISKEFVLDSSGNGYTADLSNGLAGCMTGNYDYPLRANPGIMNTLISKVPGANLVPCDPFTNKYGKRPKKLADTCAINIFVPKASEGKADEVIKYLNWMSDTKVLNFLQFGEEGKNHKVVRGLPELLPTKGETIQNSGLNIDYTMVVNGIIGKDKNDTMKRMCRQYQGIFQQAFINSWKAAEKDGYVTPETTIQETTDADAKYGTTMVSKGNEVYAKTITCSTSEFEQQWKDSTNAMMAAGATQIINERKVLWAKYHPKK